MISLVLFGSLIVFIAVGVPISFALGLSALAAIFWGDLPIVSAAQKLLTGIDSFPLLVAGLKTASQRAAGSAPGRARSP